MTPKQIAAQRARLGLSAYKYATALGFRSKRRQDNIYRYEAGKRKPSPQTITLMKGLER